MTNYTFEVGISITIDGQPFVIARIDDNGRVQLEAAGDGAITAMSKENLLTLFAKKSLQFTGDDLGTSPPDIPLLGRPLSTFPDDIQAKAIRKKKYLDWLLARGPLTTTPAALKPLILECARTLDDPCPPSPSSIYRWTRRLRLAKGDYRTLVDRVERRGGGSRLPGAVLSLLQQAIDTVYLVREKTTGRDVFYALIHRLQKENESRKAPEKLPTPSLSTIYRAIKSLDAYDVVAARQGERIAKIKFRTSGRGPQGTHILERVEIDHTPLDLFVIDEKTLLPLGRPTVTVALDKFSRMVIGIYVGFDGPSVSAVLRCLRHAILPKWYVKERYPDIEHDWPCYGQITELFCDNGLEFHSTELARVALELHTILTFCPKRKPWMKGSVERFLKTMNYQFAHALPGTSLARWFHREDYDPLSQAVVTHEQLCHVLHRWVIDVYAQSLHRGINTTPYRKWQEGAAQHSLPLPASADLLDITIGDTHRRVLSHEGIELGGLRYNDVALLPIRQKHGERVEVEVISYFDDISTIAVIDPDSKTPIVVQALDQGYAQGLTREQHRLLCARAREVNAGIVNNVALARARMEIRDLVSGLALNKSQRKRQRSAKIRAIGTGKPDILDASTVPRVAQSPTEQPSGADWESRSSASLPRLNGIFLNSSQRSGEQS
jgi:putative transposase